MSLNNLGDLNLAAGRFDTAFAKFRQSVALHDRLARDQKRSGSSGAPGRTGCGRKLCWTSLLQVSSCEESKPWADRTRAKVEQGADRREPKALLRPHL